MTHVLLVRHGANDALQSGILAGWAPGIHLNQEGRTQAEALAQRLAPVEIEAIYTSPLERTVETARIIAAVHGLPVVVRERLGEVCVGHWTGQPLEKLRTRKLWRQIQTTPSTARFPGGESMRDVQARAVAELEELQAKHRQQTIAVISHADVIKATVAYYIGLHLDLFQRLAIAPASLTVLTLDGPIPRLERLNDDSHLATVVEKEK